MEWQRLDTESGAPLWFFPEPRVHNVSLGVLVNVGSRDEKRPEEAGLAHASEHMFFQGSTVSFPNQKAGDSYIEDVGGVTDAFTDEEKTFFFHKINASQVERSVEVLGESLCHPLFPAEVIPAQMKIVQHELEGVYDNPLGLLSEKWTEKRLKGHPLSQTPSGMIKSIKRFKRDDFARWAAKFYHPANFVYLAVGNAEAEHLRDLFNKYFLWMPAAGKNLRAECRLPDKPRTPLVLRKEISEAYVITGALTGGAGNKEACALRLFTVMISGGSSFPLFSEIREQRAYCYSVQAQVDENSDVSTFYVALATSPATYEDALSLAMEIIHREKANEELLEKAKGFIRGGFNLVDDTMMMLQKTAREFFFHGRPQNHSEIVSSYDAVSIRDIEGVVDKYLKPEYFYTAVALPKKSK